MCTNPASGHARKVHHVHLFISGLLHLSILQNVVAVDIAGSIEQHFDISTVSSHPHPAGSRISERNAI
jgi:hypothetical protein